MKMVETLEKKATSVCGRDNYRGYESPLEFFNAHSELHGLSRSELQEVDCGLYASLRSYGKMDEAIPKLRKRGRKRVIV